MEWVESVMLEIVAQAVPVISHGPGQTLFEAYFRIPAGQIPKKAVIRKVIADVDPQPLGRELANSVTARATQGDEHMRKIEERNGRAAADIKDLTLRVGGCRGHKKRFHNIVYVGE